MQIRILKDAAISILKKDIKDNIDKYVSNVEWIDDYFKAKNIENYYINSNIQVESFELECGDQSKDSINAVILHKALKNLLPIHARDEKLWAYLTHTIGYGYMKSRWKIESSNDKTSRIESRYFFQGKSDNKIRSNTVPYVRNGLSRLWWAGYIVYDKTLNNPYEYIDELFVSQDMFVGLCERDIAKNKRLVIAILKMIRKYNIKNISNNTELVRNILKDINLSAGLIMYDSMDDIELEYKIDEIFKKVLIKRSSI